MKRRAFLKGAGAIAVVVAGGSVWGAYDQRAFSAGQGPACNPWEDWRGEASEGPLTIVRAGILAANPHNTQPWLFKIKNDVIELHADRRRALPVVDPYDRALVISCGAALFNLRAALRHFGYEDAGEPFPVPDNEDLLARIRMGERIRPSAADDLLFGAFPPGTRTGRHSSIAQYRSA